MIYYFHRAARGRMYLSLPLARCALLVFGKKRSPPLKWKLLCPRFPAPIWIKIDGEIVCLVQMHLVRIGLNFQALIFRCWIINACIVLSADILGKY